MKLMMKIRRFLRLEVLCMLLVSVGTALAADATSLDPTTIPITSLSTIPVGTVVSWPVGSNPSDMAKWLECNGQAVPSGSRYDRMRTILGGGAVPNYNNQFLRGTTASGLVGTQVSDTIRSHTVSVPGQNAPVSGNLNTTGLSGTAGGQHFTYQATNSAGAIVMTSAEGGTVGWADYNNSNYTAEGWTSSSSVSGSLNSGALTGTAYVSAQTGTYSGGSETAPVHTRVRYLIRAVQ